MADYRVKKPGADIWKSMAREELDRGIAEGAIGPDWEIWTGETGEILTVEEFRMGGRRWSGRVVTGFWRRDLAALIDIAILVVIGGALGSVFFYQLIRIGSAGRLLGFGIAFVYLALMNSVLSGGCTIGKRLLSMRVVDAKGEPLSVSRATVRYCLLGVPFFLNHAAVSSSILLVTLQSLIVIGLLIPILYFYFFNRRAHQSLPDLLVGSYVVPMGSEKVAPKPKTWVGHYIIAGSLALLALGAPLWAANFLGAQKMKELLSTHAILLQQPEVLEAAVSDGEQTFFDSQHGRFTITMVTSRIRLNTHRLSLEREAEKFVRVILENYPAARFRNLVSMDVYYGFDIGIAWWSVDRVVSYPPVEWERRIKILSEPGQ